MISLLTQLIRGHSDWLKTSHAPLSFIKISTPASGVELGKGKVLLLVFEEGESKPTLCVKTTRIYSAGGIIKKNYDNLKLLAKGVVGTKHASMFAEPLYLYDDGSLIFCVESVCPGARFSSGNEDPGPVMEAYIAWQSHLAHKSKEFKTLEGGIKLPVISQHGDMTPDNVLVFRDDIYLVDYDYAGECTLAGFDLVNFLSKMEISSETRRAYYEKYFPHYFESIGVKVESYQSLLPLYHLEEVRRKDRNM